MRATRMKIASEDRVAPIVGGEEVYQKLGVAVHNGAHETSLADEIEERAWEVFVPDKRVRQSCWA